jgi:DNA-binding LytR/AlgR family response regulator
LSTLFLKNGKKIHDIKPLREFEERLFDLGFFRIRSNTIINGDYITEMDTRMNKRIIKLEEIDFIVARSRLKSFRDWIS